MKVIGVEAREVHVTMDFSLTDLVKIRNIVDRAVLNFDSTNPTEKEEMACFMEFYRTVAELTKDVPDAD